ncbi:hypothetical protein [Sinomonas sp. P10A9]|uniref:Uncharacterized protein n=1 Tax=Sinomonas puerhi TaxID=3238584 RepID=A0AB39KZ25_9MICC
MMGDGLTDPAKMVERAEVHGGLGDTLFEVRHEWAAVALFYAAYHLVKASFVSDPIFDDRMRLQAIDHRLRPEDRFVTKHSYGGIGPRATRLGVDEIVTFLYPAINHDYTYLHVASCDVRYRGGLRAISLDSLHASHEAVKSAFQSGELLA